MISLIDFLTANIQFPTYVFCFWSILATFNKLVLSNYVIMNAFHSGVSYLLVLNTEAWMLYMFKSASKNIFVLSELCFVYGKKICINIYTSEFLQAIYFLSPISFL